MAENKKLDGSTEKEKGKKEENSGAVSSSLFQPEKHPWQKAGDQRSKAPKDERTREPGRRQRGHYNARRGGGRGRGPSQQSSAPANTYNDKGAERVPPDSAPARGGPGSQTKRHFHGTRQTPRGRGGTSDHSGARPLPPELYAVSIGFVHSDVLYEKNQLYVLGLHYKTTKDSVQNYIERISGEEVKHVLLFKPNGKAIVTLINKIRDFRKICSEAEKRSLDGVNVLIERAPMCKSIFVRGFSESTTKEQVEGYFDGLGELENVNFNEMNKKDKRAIVYFNDKKSVEKVVKKDHRLGDTALHVEKFFPFMGTVEPVDKPTRKPRPTSGEMAEDDAPYCYHKVDSDIMKFLDKTNQALQLKELLSRERAKIRLNNKDGYMLIKYDEKGPKLGDDESEEWKSRCSTIISNFVQRFDKKEIPVEEEIWNAVIEQLPVIDRLFPIYTAHVQAIDETKKLMLVCQMSDLTEFEDKLQDYLQKTKRTEHEKTFERKQITDISSEKLRLLQNAGIEKILKRDVHADLKTEIDLKTKKLCLITPDRLMVSANTHLRKHLDEIDQNAMENPPEILEILKTKVGKRKLKKEFMDAGIECFFDVDEKHNKVIFLGNTPEVTVNSRKLAEQLLINDNLPLEQRDNAFLQTPKWSDLCKEMEKRLKIRLKRELTCISVFGFKKDVEEAVKKMRDFLNEKKATEGQLRFDSQVLRRLFNEFYKGDIQEIEKDLSWCSVKITFEENGDLRYTGTEEGVKKVEERLYALQDKVEERLVPTSVPGMRSYLAQDTNNLITNTEREHKCVFEVKELTAAQQEEADTDSDDCSSVRSDDEGSDDDEQVLWTQERKKLIWKEGNIETEEADVLVCSVGSNLNLSIGVIARAISKAGGTSLQEELLAKATHLKEGEILHTWPGNLPCRHVIYGVCCPWDNAESEQILQNLLRNCFDRASELCACSIGVPLIGTGNLGFPYDVSVRIMVDAAFDFSKRNPNSSIEEFRFIVFSSEDTQQGISAFDDKFREERPNRVPPAINCKSGTRKKRETTLEKKTPALPDLTSKAVSVGDLTVNVVQADLINECSDGICNVIGQELDMKVGKLSAVIAEAAGGSVQDELKAKPRPFPESVVTTSAGNLPTKHILHMVVTSGIKQHLQTCVKNALTEADRQNMTSLSIPAVGSGGLRLTPEESAEVVFGAVHAFAVATSNSLREVRIVVFDKCVFWAFVQSRFCNEGTKLELNDEKVEDNPELNDEILLIVHGNRDYLDAAITALENGVKKVCRTENVNDDIIARLSPRTRKNLARKARQCDVHLNYLNGNTIELQGLSGDIINMYSHIQEQLKKERKEEQAELTSKAVQWVFCDASGKFKSFDKFANDVIEKAYQSNKPSVSFFYKGSPAELNFETMEVNLIKTRAIKAVRRRDVIPLRKEWEPQPLDELTGKEKTVHLVPLEKDSALYQEIEKKFFQSGNESVSIKRILRVQNPSMYRSYVMRRQNIELKNGNHKNELQLFHGTKYENVKNINAQGFNRSFCGQQGGAAYGNGVYFAKDAYCSSYYSKEGANGERCMYLASVLVGKYTTGDRGMRAPPPRDPSVSEDLYDSVVNDTDDPTIFVVFNDYQCYPDYIIYFK